MSYLFKNRNGQTPLPLELRKGLIPKNIQTIGDLDEYEENNILDGLNWLSKKNNKKSFDRYFWISLHKKLFGKVWSWAGVIRMHELNNPDFSEPFKIQVELKKLEKNLAFWHEEKTYSEKEIITRFHERLLTIHPFPNGNGRFSRIICEKLGEAIGTQPLTWGDNAPSTDVRRAWYIEAIKTARHKRNYSKLQDFIFS